MKHLRFLAVLIALSFSFVSVASAQSLRSLEDQSHEMMTQALNDAIGDFKDSDGQLIVITGVICPHAMLAMAAVGSGAMDPKAGQRAMMAGLVRDQADMMTAKLAGGPSLSFERGTGVNLTFKLADGVTPDTLIGMAEAGIKALN